MQLPYFLPLIQHVRGHFRRTELAAAALMLLPALAKAQAVPPIAKTSTFIGQSYFLFSDDAARKTQLLYPPATLAGPVAAGTIQRVYFMYGDFGSGPTFADLAITLGQTPNDTFVPSTTFYPNQDTVFQRTTHTIPYGQRAGLWFAFDLDHPFTYDPTQTLVVTVSWQSNNGISFLTAGDPVGPVGTTGKKLYSGTPNATTGDATSVVWQNFGFTLGPVGLAEEEPSFSSGNLFPNPATDVTTLRLANATAPAVLTLTDLTGRTVRQFTATPTELQSGYPLKLQGLPTGSYALKVAQNGQRITRKLVVK